MPTFNAGDTDYIAKLNALSVGGGVPVTTKGDLVTYDSAVVRLAVGTNGYVLMADSGEAKGIKWAAIPATAVGSITGFGTGVATALAVNVGSAGAPVLFNGAGGTPSSLTLTNGTGLPLGGVTGFGTGNATALAVNVGSTGSFNPMTTAGDTIIGGASGSPTRLAAGSTSGHVLTSTGAGSAPSWQAASGGMTNPMTTGGDVIYGGASGTPTRLANGSAGEVLTSAGGTSAPTWSPASGGTPAYIEAAAVHHNHLSFGAF